MKPSLNDKQRMCLDTLADITQPYGEFCTAFRPIATRTGLDWAEVRRCVRYLARKGLAEFHRPLWNDDGPAGAGYCITPKGIERLRHD